MASSDESVLIGGVEKREIVIAPYDPAWPTIYQRHANVLRQALGATLLRVEHIGSTAVPGLAAKPIVDLLAVVPDSANEADYAPRLEAAGYVLRVREPSFHEHRMFRTPERDVHVHVYGPASPEIGRNLAFRDRLRNNADARRRYEAVKRTLASQEWSDVNEYALAKTEIIESILAQ
jgi:GrpB-like predicted nucleotidyltransferase (UPF0157 family)